MQITKNMKAGYQGKRDAMRVKAEKMLNHPGTAKDVYYSKSAVDKEHMRPYKTGGHVTNQKEDEEMKNYKSGGSTKKSQPCQKFAMGGVAKIRHEEATSQGLPKEFKKKSFKEVL